MDQVMIGIGSEMKKSLSPTLVERVWTCPTETPQKHQLIAESLG